MKEKHYDSLGYLLNVGDIVVFTTSDTNRLYLGIIDTLYKDFALIRSEKYNTLTHRAKPYYKNIVKYTSLEIVDRLEYESRVLKALNAYGVDSWSGYEDAIHDSEDILGYKVAEE